MALVFNGYELPPLILSAPVSTAPIAATNPPASLVVRLGVITPTPHWRAPPEEHRRERLARCPVAGLSVRN
jgi:hypothetical protein